MNLEPGQSARGDVEAGMRTVIGALARSARRYLGDRHPEDWTEAVFRTAGAHGALQSLLFRWSEERTAPSFYYWTRWIPWWGIP